MLFHPCLYDDDWKTLNALTNEKVEQTKQEQKELHNNKLTRLGVLPRIDDKNVNTTKRGIEKDRREANNSAAFMSDAIYNFSNRELSDIEKSVLRKCLKFGIKAKRVDTFELLARFEELAETLNPLPIAEHSKSKYQADVNSKNNFFRQLQIMSTSFFSYLKRLMTA